MIWGKKSQSRFKNKVKLLWTAARAKTWPCPLHLFFLNVHLLWSHHSKKNGKLLHPTAIIRTCQMLLIQFLLHKQSISILSDGGRDHLWKSALWLQLWGKYIKRSQLGKMMMQKVKLTSSKLTSSHFIWNWLFFVLLAALIQLLCKISDAKLISTFQSSLQN